MLSTAKMKITVIPAVWFYLEQLMAYTLVYTRKVLDPLKLANLIS